jgi:hypothetical protein
MKNLINLGSLLFVFFLTACSMSELGAPPLNQEDRWVRTSYTKIQIRSALRLCGQDEPWSIQNMEKVDWCMLKQGFIFIDSPYRYAHKRCDGYEPYKNLPSCRFLRGELSVPENQNQSTQPPLIQVPKSSNGESASAPITPVLNPSEQVLRENLKDLQRAQEKTQIKPDSPPANLPVGILLKGGQ